jgi:hypothetical protein
MTKTYIVRKGSRAPVHCPFSYFYDGTLAKGMIWDISETGWRATGERPVVEGTETTVYVTLPDSGESRNILVEAAVVRWSEGRDSGWEITRIDEETRARLDHFLENLNATGVASETKERTHSW